MTTTAAPGWPFWAATSDARIDEALDLACLRPGDRFVDLGCGDGRVLLRAAEGFGATVTGIELDPTLAATARDVLDVAGVNGTVQEADFDSVPIEADVVFAFLSPAVLQGLRPRLAALAPGARVITTGYPIPGWIPHNVGDRCFLYRIPAVEAPVESGGPGWVSNGILVSVPSGPPTLVAVKLRHGGGPVEVSVEGAELARWLKLRPGAADAGLGDEVVVDLRFDPMPAGTAVAGSLQAAGVGPLAVYAVADAGDSGIWGLSGSGCELAAERMGRGEILAVVEEARRRT